MLDLLVDWNLSCFVRISYSLFFLICYQIPLSTSANVDHASIHTDNFNQSNSDIRQTQQVFNGSHPTFVNNQSSGLSMPSITKFPDFEITRASRVSIW